MIDLNMQLGIDVGGKKFTGTIREVVGINEGNLTEEFINQPSLYAWFAVLSEIASAEVETKKFETSVLRANLDGEKRKELSEQSQKEIEGKKKDGKVTEAMVESAIITDRRYMLCTQELAELQRQLGILKSMVRALEQRKDCLIQIGSMKRQEMVMTDFGIDLKKVRNNG